MQVMAVETAAEMAGKANRARSEPSGIRLATPGQDMEAAAREGFVWREPLLIVLLALALHFWRLTEIPPGLDEDSAANGWLAVQWLRGGPFPFWNGRNGAFEPIMVALQTVTTVLFGPSILALRSVSAVALALAAGAVYGVTWEAGRALSPLLQRWGARLAAVALAASPVMLELGRTGLRATLLPLVVGLLIWSLLVALRTLRPRHFALAGLILGIGAYTYLAARLLPVGVGLVLLLRLSTGFAAPEMRRFLAGAAWLVGLAFAVVLPQIAFFVLHPHAFLARAGAVTLAQNPLAQEIGYGGVLAQKLWHMARLFGVEWWGQYNQAARPLLSPPAFVGFLAALGLVILNRRTAGIQALVIFIPVMLIPDLLGGDRLEPHSLRVIGALLPAFALSGLGLAWLIQKVVYFLAPAATRWTDRAVLLPQMVGGTVLLVMALWGVVDWVAVITPRLAQSDYSWYAREDVALADWINAQAEPVLVPLYELSRPNLAYLTAARAGPPQGALQWDENFTGAAQNVSDENFSGILPVQWHPQVFENMNKAWLVLPVPPPRPRVEASSYRYDPSVLVLLAHGRAWLLPPLAETHLPPEGDMTTACGQPEVIGVLNRVVAQACVISLEPEMWSLPQPALATNSAGTNYRFDNGLTVRWTHGPGVELTGGSSVDINSYWQALQPHNRARRMFVHVLDDTGTRVAGEDFMPAYGLYGTEMWEPGALIPLRQSVELPPVLLPGRYWLAVGLYDPLSEKISEAVAVESGTEVAQARFGPLKVSLPASVQAGDEGPSGIWATTGPAQRVSRVQIGPAITLGGYVVDVLGLPDATSGSQSVTASAASQAILGQKNAPDEGNEIELSVRLYLEAETTPATDYTFFLHVVDSEGAIVAQHDTQPVAWNEGPVYPTGIWSPGEAVVVELSARLPPRVDLNAVEPETAAPEAGDAGAGKEDRADVYTLWVGAYVWATGERVSLTLDESMNRGMNAESPVIEDQRLQVGHVPVAP